MYVITTTLFRKKRFEINYVDIDQGIYKVKLKVALNEKWKKLHGGFLFP